jgi:hypothetical protein
MVEVERNAFETMMSLGEAFIQKPDLKLQSFSRGHWQFLGLRE